MAASGEMLPFRRRGSFGRSAELLCLGSLILLINLCAPVSSQTPPQAGVLPPEYVLPGGKVTFVKNGDKNLYGNNVTYRSTVLVEYSQKCWVDYETPLPAGVLVRFFIYIHSLAPTIDAQSLRLRLQIWRESDPNIRSFRLVWQQRVEINYTGTGALYSFKMDKTVTVEAGDKIGFTNEGNYGLISFQYVEGHRTFLAPVNLTKNSATPVPVYPKTGDVVKFDQVYLPSAYSIAVELDQTQPGQTAPQGVTDSNGASGSGYTGALVLILTVSCARWVHQSLICL